MNDPSILFSIFVRIFAAIGAYLTVIRRLQDERDHIPEPLKNYNTKLIMSVSAFIATCIGTALFQACRIGLVNHCSDQWALDVVSLFNSFSLLFAFLVMYLIIDVRDEGGKVKQNKDIKIIQKDVKEVKKDVKEVKSEIVK